MHVKMYKVVPTRDAFEVRQNGTETVVARAAFRVTAEQARDALNKCAVLPAVVASGSNSDRDIAIGKDAFDTGYNAAAQRAVDFAPTIVRDWAAHRETAWSEYTPPEALCGGA